MDNDTLVITFDNAGHCASTYGISIDMSHFDSFKLDSGSFLNFSDIPKFMSKYNELQVYLPSDSKIPWVGKLYKCSGRRLDDTHYIATLSVTPKNMQCERLQNIHNKMPIALFEYKHEKNKPACFSYMSDFFMELFGVDSVEKGKYLKDFLKFVDQSDREDVHISIVRAEKSCADWECEFKAVINDVTKWIYGHAIPVSHTKRSKYIGFLIDISKKKDLELQLIKESTVDPLTGAYNRRYFIEQLNEELYNYHRNPRRHMSLLAIDFDLFKNINDEYGHDAGDIVLQTISKLIMNHIRKTDCFARVGGEEFSLILPNTDSKLAFKIAEKLRELVENTNITYLKKLISITITVGVASTDHGHKQAKNIMRSADRALYEGKEAGRNCVK